MEKRRRTIWKMYESGLNWSQIAKELGLSRERVQQIAGLRVTAPERRVVLNRMDGHCERCNKETDQPYVSRSVAGLIGTCKDCFYELNKRRVYEQTCREPIQGP